MQGDVIDWPSCQKGVSGCGSIRLRVDTRKIFSIRLQFLYLCIHALKNHSGTSTNYVQATVLSLV